MVKPVIKWVGGKTQIIELVLKKFPEEINDYHEIFLGGGSVLLGLLQDTRIKVKGKYHAYDNNEGLIGMYKNIQKNPEELWNTIDCIIKEFDTCKEGAVNRKSKTISEALECKENYYYFSRRLFNEIKDKTSVLYSALFIFLNKTCFRGLYREGPNGFNVPYGHYKNCGILDKEHLLDLSKLIISVVFKCCKFENSMDKAKNVNDFVYLDPPYYKEKKNSFVGYNKDGFDEEQHELLFEKTKNLQCNFLMSNSDTTVVKEAFKDFEIDTFSCKRSINSKNPSSKTNDVLIKKNLTLYV